MKKTTSAQSAARPFATFVLVLVSLSWAGCFRSLNVSKLTCSKDESCPHNYFCSIESGTTGICIPGHRGDASVSVSSRGEVGDGSSDDEGGILDGPRESGSSDGKGETGTDIGGTGGTITTTGGAAGTTATGGMGGEGGVTTTDTGFGGAGGSDIDAPVLSPDDAGGMGGNGGSTPVDAPVAGTSGTGGTGGTGGLGGTASSRDAAVPDTSTLSPNGTACQRDGECALGFCTDGVCCSGRCDGKCQSCAESGSVGTCKTVTSGQPRPPRTACEGTGKCQGTCDGTSPTACKMPGANQVVCQDESCAAGKHTPPSYCNVNGTCSTQSALDCPTGLCDGITCAGSCSANSCPEGQYCSSGTCAAKKGNGTGNTCSSPNECLSGKCSPDGVCCSQDCPGQCQTCNNTAGTCTRVASGQPATPRAACTNSTDTSCGGRCDGTSDSCTYPATGKPCGGAAICSTPEYMSSIASACDSYHACSPVTTSCLALGACIGGSCAAKIATTSSTACQSDVQCVSGHCCNPTTGGRCRDFTSDNANCGSCGRACQSGKTCQSGDCACPLNTFACGGGACVDVYSSDEHCGTTCQDCRTAQGLKCITGSCSCAGWNSTCGCLSWNFNDSQPVNWPEQPTTGGNYCSGQNNYVGAPPAPTLDGTPAFKMGGQCDAGTVMGTTITLSCSGTGVVLNGRTFSAKVRFTLPFSGALRIWTNGTTPSGVATNINENGTIPADTWVNVTAVISDNGSRSTQLGINLHMPYDLTSYWGADIWLDDITIK